MDTIPLPDGVNHVVTFAEYARVGGELDAARLERDRLAAENAELKATIRTLRFNLRRKQAPDEHLFTEPRDAELAAANATLDALREAVSCDSEELPCKKLLQIQAILYPQPKETTHDDE